MYVEDVVLNGSQERETFPNTGSRLSVQEFTGAMKPENISKPNHNVVKNIYETAITNVSNGGDQKTLSNPQCGQLRISKYLQSGFHTSVAGLATVVSLLAFDFTIAFLPISVDLVTLIVISLVLCFFIVEIILTSLADPKYKVTFFCTLDVVGAISLIPDMLQLIEGMGLLDYGSGDGASGMNNAGKVGRVARAGGTLKLAKFARIFRVVRLVRVIRLFRMSMQDGVHQVEQAPSRPSTVGRLLATKVTQRIVALITAMILVLPYLEVAPLTGSVTMQTTLQNIEYIEPKLSAHFNSSVMSLVQTMAQTEQPFVYLRIAGIVIVDVYSKQDLFNQNNEFMQHEYRTNDVISHCVGGCDGQSMLSEYYSAAQNSVKNGNSIQAQLSMAMCFFVVLAFVLSSHAVSNDARDLVIKPIERMTKIVHKLASTVCILSNENHQNHGSGGDGGGGGGGGDSRLSSTGGNTGGRTGESCSTNYNIGNSHSIPPHPGDRSSIKSTNGTNDAASFRGFSSLEGLNEAELLEEVMTQMTVALNEKNSSRSNSNRSSTSGRRSSGGMSYFSRASQRASQFMNQRRSSTIRSSASPAYSSNSDKGPWKSRFSFAGSAHIFAVNNGISGSAGTSSNLTQSSFSQLPPRIRDDVKSHAALHSIESILQSRLACKYLRQHMARTLTLENYMFWDEVEKLKAMQVSLRLRIFERFVQQSSPNQVNLDSSTRGRIEMLMGECAGVTTMFDDAQKMVMNLMQLNSYIPFLQSDKCRQFVQEADLHKRMLNMPTSMGSRGSAYAVQIKDGNTGPTVINVEGA